MRPLRTKGGVVPVARVHDGVVAVPVEHLRLETVDQRFEVLRTGGTARTAGEQAVAGEQLHGVARGGAAQREGNRSLGVTLEVDDVEGEFADLDGVAVGQDAIRRDGQRFGVELVRGGRCARGARHLGKRLPVIAVLMSGHDESQGRGVLLDQVEKNGRVVRRVDE